LAVCIAARFSGRKTVAPWRKPGVSMSGLAPKARFSGQKNLCHSCIRKNDPGKARVWRTPSPICSFTLPSPPSTACRSSMIRCAPKCLSRRNSPRDGGRSHRRWRHGGPRASAGASASRSRRGRLFAHREDKFVALGEGALAAAARVCVARWVWRVQRERIATRRRDSLYPEPGETSPAGFVSRGVSKAAQRPRRRVRRAVHLAVVLSPAKSGLAVRDRAVFPSLVTGATIFRPPRRAWGWRDYVA